jgi:hypothetical protein
MSRADQSESKKLCEHPSRHVAEVHEEDERSSALAIQWFVGSIEVHLFEQYLVARSGLRLHPEFGFVVSKVPNEA